MAKSRRKIERTDDSIININRRKCVGCTACAMACTDITNMPVLKCVNDIRSCVTARGQTFEESGCIYCGQCTLVCQSGAIDMRNDISKVTEALKSGKYMVAIASPAVKASLGEEFGLPVGSNVEGKVQSSARKIGFQKVFDSDFGADISAVEEAHELLKRIRIKDKLPMFTASCPSWVRWAEIYNPEIISYLSTSKSPQQMMGTAIKTYYAEKFKILPKNIFVLSIETCPAKKYEAERPDMGRKDYVDIDAVLTVREYAELLRMSGIDITAIASEKSDDYMDKHSGGGSIFAYSGGNLKAVIRELARELGADSINYSKLQPIKYLKNSIHGIITVGNVDIRAAVINTISDMKEFLSRDGWKEYDFIDVTVCRGGCVNGGGCSKIKKKAHIIEDRCINCGTCVEKCPSHAIEMRGGKCAEVDEERCIGCGLCDRVCRTNAVAMELYNPDEIDVISGDYVELRKKVIDDIDKSCSMRCSDDNSQISDMYNFYDMEPFSEKARDLFHQSYADRSYEINIKEKSHRLRHK